MRNATTVLIIEDSASVCMFMAQTLQKVGYRVITAADGHEGVTKVIQERPHCVVLDVILPGINGFEVCRRLRTMDPQRSFAIILASIKNTAADQSWGLRQGADRYLPKPFTAEALVQLVGDVLPEGLRPPAAPQQVTGNQRHPPAQKPLPDWRKLIPHRVEDADLLTTSNPLSGSVAISDKQARHLYAAIDGRKNVEELCKFTRLDMIEVYKALQTLLAQHRIQLYTPPELLTDTSLFPNDL